MQNLGGISLYHTFSGALSEAMWRHIWAPLESYTVVKDGLKA
jgi:hypothetical protein